jgi:hypothetical protein
MKKFQLPIEERIMEAEDEMLGKEVLLNGGCEGEYFESSG